MAHIHHSRYAVKARVLLVPASEHHDQSVRVAFGEDADVYFEVSQDEARDMAAEILALLQAVSVQPQCDVEISADAEPRPTFVDVTHSVFQSGEAVYSGTKDECQTFADNHFPSGGYGIGPIQG